MTYAVRWSFRFERDADKIYQYIFERAPDGANRWYRALLDALELLKSNPTGRPFAPENQLVAAEVRQILFKTKMGRTYRVLFVVSV